MMEWAAIGCIALWGAALTVFVMRSSCHTSQAKADKSGPTMSGPTIIKNFMKDRFGNIVRRDKRPPRRGDDLTAYTYEQKERENGH